MPGRTHGAERGVTFAALQPLGHVQPGAGREQRGIERLGPRRGCRRRDSRRPMRRTARARRCRRRVHPLELVPGGPSRLDGLDRLLQPGRGRCRPAPLPGGPAAPDGPRPSRAAGSADGSRSSRATGGGYRTQRDGLRAANALAPTAGPARPSTAAVPPGPILGDVVPPVASVPSELQLMTTGDWAPIGATARCGSPCGAVTTDGGRDPEARSGDAGARHHPAVPRRARPPGHAPGRDERARPTGARCVPRGGLRGSRTAASSLSRPEAVAGLARPRFDCGAPASADRATVLALDRRAFDTFWGMDDAGLSEALAATPISRFRVAIDR